MTNAEMLANVRTYLDEASEKYYLDDEEIYPALTNAQWEVINYIGGQMMKMIENNADIGVIPLAVRPIVAYSSGVLTSGLFEATVAGMLFPFRVVWNPAGADLTDYPNAKQCVWIPASKFELFKGNTYLSDGHYVTYDEDTKLHLNPASTNANATYKVWHLNTPTNEITASNNATLHEVAHEAICRRAGWLLLKDRETEQANLHLQMYSNLIQGLV